MESPNESIKSNEILHFYVLCICEREREREIYFPFLVDVCVYEEKYCGYIHAVNNQLTSHNSLRQWSEIFKLNFLYINQVL